MSNIDYITKYLNDYLNMDNPQYAVLIQGKWGCGKTFYINQLIEKWKNKNNETVPPNCIKLRPIYISLYGASSISQVSYLIRKELRPFLYSKGMKVAKKIFCGIIKTATQGNFDFNGDGNTRDFSAIFDTESIIEILSKPNDYVKGDKILIFDDLERCKIPIDEIFGYINNLVEHSKCKIIIIGDEDKIKKQSENNTLPSKYAEFKEKLIGQTFSIRQDLDTIIETFINDSHNHHLQDNKELISDLFIASQTENLRIIKQCFSDFNRLISFINATKYNKSLYEIFIQNVIAYFIITYCEYKNGNNYIKYFQNHTSYFTDETVKENVLNIENKYISILEKYNIKYSYNSITIKDIISFIDNGYISNLTATLNKSDMLNIPHSQDWEQLWYYGKLDNNTFLEKLKSVKNLFYKGEIKYVSIVLHITGMFIHFNRIKLAHCNESFLKQKALNHIDKIFKKQNDNGCFLIGSYNASWGKQYMEYESEIMTELFKYAQDKLDNYFEYERVKFCKSFWENIDDDKAENISSVFKETIPSGYCSYELSSIFQGINTKRVASRLSRLSNTSKENIEMYLSIRYYLPETKIIGAISQYHLDDLEYLKGIKELLIKLTSKQRLIDKLTTKSLICTLDKCINQLISSPKTV